MSLNSIEQNQGASLHNEIVLLNQVVEEKSTGLRFAIPSLGQFATGFILRFNGELYAYVNQCAHIPIELDWNQGDFLDSSKQFIVCATHGAHYLPESGQCVIGPCKGKQLKQLHVTEKMTERGNEITILID